MGCRNVPAQTLSASSERDRHPCILTVGPLRLVVPQDKRPARWVRMLKSLTVVQLGK
jgi:hypothetical protein